ncbi:MAG: divalent-cation tolerance protein CutA [Pyrinomonadaceae bacterium]
MLVVLTTTPSVIEGEALAERIVNAKLATCVQIIPQITSVYFWEGSVQKANEQLLLIKTTEEKYSELERFITENHSYDIPEIAAIKSENVSTPYRNWLEGYLSE